ncbi:MAG: hypothetical protein CSA33_04790 [Desulfobulbus propionicus]|nr:MAG: hypothetical protein CSA33_04790 [Desulfobulbus propionicus]
MHDVERNSIFHKSWEEKARAHGTDPHGVHPEHHIHQYHGDDHDQDDHHHHHQARQGWLDVPVNSAAPDWFAVFGMSVMILAGSLQWVPGTLAEGLLVAGAVIGLYPPLKNSLFSSLQARRPSRELSVCLLLTGMLFYGMSLEVALCTLTLMLGSYLDFNFAWKG